MSKRHRRKVRRLNRRVDQLERQLDKQLVRFQKEILHGVTHLLEEFVPLDEPKRRQR